MYMVPIFLTTIPKMNALVEPFPTQRVSPWPLYVANYGNVLNKVLP